MDTATCYEDIIKIRACRAVFDITDKASAKEWISFIANKQFNDILRIVIKSVRANDIDYHKSFWLYGSYGTGKSHAAAVISHLLGDKKEEIEQWVNNEYQGEKAEIRRDRQDILTLRENKRLLPVNIKGLESMTRESDLALVIQRSVADTLKKHQITFSERIHTEFDNYADNIESHDEMWSLLIKRNNDLSNIVSDCNQLVDMLRRYDTKAYNAATSALRDESLSLSLNNNNITSWLIEAQNALAAEGDYNGFLIVWDEFTDVMSTIGTPALKALQTIAEEFAKGDNNNSYLFLISHPSAFDHMNNDQQKQTDGRYHKMQYNMEPVSAFRIMSRKFSISNADKHKDLSEAFYKDHPELLEIFSQTSNDENSTKEDIRNLFPLHPGTANLAAHYATVVGSSSRSVFEFLGQNDDIKSFLSDKEQFSKKATITADYLWDYVLKVFQGDITSYGAVTERFNSHQQKVANQGASYLAVFKATLLLNAFNNISAENNNGLVTPSEENIKRLFIGTDYEAHIDDILTWFNGNGIIQRSPSGLFSVQFSALPTNEIEELKNSLRKEFEHTCKIVKLIDSKKDTFAKSLNLINRPYQYGCFSRLQNRTLLKNEIKKARKAAKSYELFFAFLFSKDDEEREELKAFAAECMQDEFDKELEQIVFIVFDRTFSVKEYERFIEYQANYKCASNHGLAGQAQTHMENASGMVRKWIADLLRGTASVYIKGIKEFSCTFSGWPQKVNSEITPALYPYAPDAHLAFAGSKKYGTFWKKQNSKDIVRRMLDAPSPDDFINNLNAPMSPIKFLIQDALDDKDWKWKTNVAPDHPLKQVDDKVASIIASADKSVPFNFADKFKVLTKPPYGLFENFACMAMVAFSLRRSCVGKIFDTQGKPLKSLDLTNRISALFKAWENNKSNNSALEVKFQKPEEGKLCKEFVCLFNLNRLDKDLTESASLAKARGLITVQFADEVKAPLWAIKYTPKGVFCGLTPPNDEMKTLIDNISTICRERESDNSSLYDKTLSLINTYRFEMQNILNCKEAFGEGLRNFLTSNPKLHISGREEVDEALEYITQHSASTIGLWEEDEVVKLVMEWRIISTQPPFPPPPPPPKPTPPDPPKPPSDEALQKARTRIKNIDSLDEAKKLLEVLCEKQISSVIDEIINFLEEYERLSISIS